MKACRLGQHWLSRSRRARSLQVVVVGAHRGVTYRNRKQRDDGPSHPIKEAQILTQTIPVLPDPLRVVAAPHTAVSSSKGL